jgi:hypothetical protein
LIEDPREVSPEIVRTLVQETSHNSQGAIYKMKTLRTLAVLSVAALLLFAGVPSFAQYAPSSPSYLSAVAGRFIAQNYNYPPTANYIGGPGGGNGGNSVGASSITVQTALITLPDGRTIFPYNIFTPIIVGGNGVQEYVLPTGVSNCYYNSSVGNGTCTISGTFTFAHSNGEAVVSGTAGLAEAIYDASLVSGGLVTIDRFWTRGINTTCSGCPASADALINSLVVFPTVGIEQISAYPVRYWSAAPSNAAFLAVPTTLTAVTALPSTTPPGAFGTGTYHLCVAYVDVMGNEGPCSLDFSEAGLASGSFIFTPPAASAGAVGYTVYISLTGGTYALAYQVPLLSTVCTLTTVESITPACAVTNTAYGQVGATATVTAITVNTSPLALQLGAASTTADYVGNSNGHTAYAYVPGSHVAAIGMVAASLPFTACPATVATTVPCVIGTLAVTPNLMNYIGKEIRVCGKEQLTGASATVEKIQLWWDGAGSDAAGVPVNIANLSATVGPNTAAAYTGQFCWQGFTTAQGTSVTAGSIEGGYSFWEQYLSATPAAIFVGGDTFTATTGSLNLAGGAGFSTRLHVVQLHTTGTDVSPQLVNLTFEVLN